MNWTLFFLIATMIFNILFIWYIVKMIKRVLGFQERLDEFVDKLDEYEEHVNMVYNLETFYGDATLSKLLKHSKAIVDECRDFKTLYYGDLPLELTDEDELEYLDGS